MKNARTNDSFTKDPLTADSIIKPPVTRGSSTSKISLAQDKIYGGSLILVNASCRFRGKNDDLLIPVHDSAPDILLNRRAAILLSQLMEEIDGWRHIVPVSGWRSQEEQQAIWDDTVKESGLEFTRKYVAVPGHSEHQTGLAIDLGLKQEHIDFICPEFPYTGICQTFRDRAAKYGFILRYPAGKEHITGIGHEPWHFRYVGIPHAEIMAANGLTLEEYTDLLTRYPYGDKPYRHISGGRDIYVSYIRAAEGETVLDLPESLPYSLSGNNRDGYILTEWRTENAQQNQLRRA